jgi:hypothetical protein
MTSHIEVQVCLGTIPNKKDPRIGIEAVNEAPHACCPHVDRFGRSPTSCPVPVFEWFTSRSERVQQMCRRRRVSSVPNQ